MQEKKNSVLVDFAMSLLMIEQNMYPQNVIRELEEAFEALVTYPEYRNKSIKIINKYVDGDDIISRMLDIINCVNEPPPKAPELEEYGFERRKKTRGWTVIEDNRLIMAVNEYSIVNLGAVAAFVGSGRSRSQCSQRWIRVLDPKLSKMPWKSEEDEMLLSLCKTLGTKSWMKIATKMGKRSDVQCRYRYTQLTKDQKNKPIIKKIESSTLQSESNNNINNSINNDIEDNNNTKNMCSFFINQEQPNQESNQTDLTNLDFSNPYPDFQIESNNNDIKLDFNFSDSNLWMI